MDENALPYRVEPMVLDDLDEVMAIETLVHAAPWPASAYRHELQQNDLAHYLVLLPSEEGHRAPAGIRQRLRAWLRRTGNSRPILGYGGFWLMVGEAHISTIAIHPEWRGLGLGELMLFELLGRARALRADLVTLEVRISNTTAQNLYHKYQFEIVGRRKRYYRDNNEDAYIMTVPDILMPTYGTFLEERWQILQERFAQA